VLPAPLPMLVPSRSKAGAISSPPRALIHPASFSNPSPVVAAGLGTSAAMPHWAPPISVRPMPVTSRPPSITTPSKLQAKTPPASWSSPSVVVVVSLVPPVARRSPWAAPSLPAAPVTPVKSLCATEQRSPPLASTPLPSSPSPSVAVVVQQPPMTVTPFAWVPSQRHWMSMHFH